MNAKTAELLEIVVAYVRRYIVINDDEAAAVGLWAMHTHVPGALGITPYLSITSAEKGSGKTQLLETLGFIVAKPWMTGSVSAATLARKIDVVQPTLLLDESDAVWNGDKEFAETLRGVLNTGFKASGIYSRCVGNGNNLTVQDFKTFCPKAIAGIDRLPDTVADRSIRIRLKKKTAAEPVEKWRDRKVAAEGEPIRERLEQWAERFDERLGQVQLAELDELQDRANDIWEPLLGIAYVAGEKSFIRARKAAIALSSVAAAEDESTGVQLLRDIHAIFTAQGVDRISSAALVADLHEIEESPWGEWHGKPISANGIAKLLKRFEIRPRSVRLEDGTIPRGYHREQFGDVWSRYLPIPPFSTATPPQPASLSGKPADSNRHTNEPVAVGKVAANPHEQSDVADVAVTNGGMGAEDDEDGPWFGPDFVQAELDYYREQAKKPPP